MNEINRLNPAEIDLFDVLGNFGEQHITHEEPHSDIIAFFLKQEPRLLENLLKHFRCDVSNMQFSEITVEREKAIGESRSRPDILVKIPLINSSEGSGFAIVIENKMSSFEHGDQLQTYYNEIRQKYNNNSLFIYLSSSGRKSSHGNYEPLRYEKLGEILNETSVADSVIQTLLSLYVKTLNKVAKKSAFQDDLAATLQQLVRDTKEVDLVSFYNNTWIDFEPKGWGDIITNRWKGKLPTPKDGIWGFSFYLTQQDGLSLEFYFLRDFSYFSSRVYEAARGREPFHEPRRVGQGKNEWMSIYSHQIFDADKLKTLEKAYSDNNHFITNSDVEREIKEKWAACINDFDSIRSLIESIHNP